MEGSEDDYVMQNKPVKERQISHTKCDSKCKLIKILQITKFTCK